MISSRRSFQIGNNYSELECKILHIWLSSIRGMNMGIKELINSKEVVQGPISLKVHGLLEPVNRAS